MIITKRLGKGILKKCIPEKNQNPNLDNTIVNICNISSVYFADSVDKKHYHIMRDIRELKCSAECRRKNFKLDMRYGDNNRLYPFYKMSPQGGTLLLYTYRYYGEYREEIVEKLFKSNIDQL